jgi:hypothetical protein
MKKCEECGKEISSTAKTCPNCGAKQDMGWCLKTVLGTVFVIVVGIFLYFLSHLDWRLIVIVGATLVIVFLIVKKVIKLIRKK